MTNEDINPISYIEDEFDELAEKILVHFSMTPLSSLKSAIRQELEEWKKRKIVRFHYTQLKSEIKIYRENIDTVEPLLLDRFLDVHKDEIQEMAGYFSEDDEEMAITWYMIAFKENF